MKILVKKFKLHQLDNEKNILQNKNITVIKLYTMVSVYESKE